jgi:hypothetical protein
MISCSGPEFSSAAVVVAAAVAASARASPGAAMAAQAKMIATVAVIGPWLRKA